MVAIGGGDNGPALRLTRAEMPKGRRGGCTPATPAWKTAALARLLLLWLRMAVGLETTQ